MLLGFAFVTIHLSKAARAVQMLVQLAPLINGDGEEGDGIHLVDLAVFHLLQSYPVVLMWTILLRAPPVALVLVTLALVAWGVTRVVAQSILRVLLSRLELLLLTSDSHGREERAELHGALLLDLAFVHRHLCSLFLV